MYVGIQTIYNEWYVTHIEGCDIIALLLANMYVQDVICV